MPRKTLSLVAFSCPRTCPLAGERFCRFRPLLDSLGPAKVCSHTCTVAVEYSDPETLRRAVEALGGIWHGWAEHRLADTSEQGWGFRLRTSIASMNGGGFPIKEGQEGVGYWLMPIVLRPDGQLAFDDYDGHWGNPKDLEALKEEYTLTHAMRQAELLGWQCERTSEGVTVFHPAGGELRLSHSGECETFGFVGGWCHSARLQLGLTAASDTIVNKPEAAQQVARCGVGVG